MTQTWDFPGGHEKFDAQVLRSIGRWSSRGTSERSIYRAYCSMIKNASCIYIENQFFVSALEGTGGVVRNRIAQYLYDRVSKAIRHREQFKVTIVIPLYPEGDPSSLQVGAILHYQNESICNGRESLLGSLRSFPDVDIGKYISFHSLHQLRSARQ